MARRPKPRTIQGEKFPDNGVPQGSLAVTLDLRGVAHPGFVLSKACEEAERYIAKHPEDKDLIDRALALQIAKVAESARERQK